MDATQTGLPAILPGDSLGLVDGPVAIVILAILLLPVTILLAVFVVEWLLVLLLLPLATLVSAYVGRPWVVVARQGTGFPAQFLVRRQRRRYARGVNGWRGSRHLIAEVRREIAEHGAPQSLGEPGPLRPARPIRYRRTLSSGQ